MGNAGHAAIRLSLGLLAARHLHRASSVTASLSRRPMERVAAPLRRMGRARIDTTAGMPPVVVHGGARLTAIRYQLPSQAAQVKSALLAWRDFMPKAPPNSSNPRPRGITRNAC